MHRNFVIFFPSAHDKLPQDVREVLSFLSFSGCVLPIYAPSQNVGRLESWRGLHLPLGDAHNQLPDRSLAGSFRVVFFIAYFLGEWAKKSFISIKDKTEQVIACQGNGLEF